MFTWLSVHKSMFFSGALYSVFAVFIWGWFWKSLFLASMIQSESKIPAASFLCVSIHAVESWKWAANRRTTDWRSAWFVEMCIAMRPSGFKCLR